MFACLLYRDLLAIQINYHRRAQSKFDVFSFVARTDWNEFYKVMTYSSSSPTCIRRLSWQCDRSPERIAWPSLNLLYGSPLSTQNNSLYPCHVNTLGSEIVIQCCAEATTLNLSPLYFCTTLSTFAYTYTENVAINISRYLSNCRIRMVPTLL